MTWNWAERIENWIWWAQSDVTLKLAEIGGLIVDETGWPIWGKLRWAQ